MLHATWSESAMVDTTTGSTSDFFMTVASCTFATLSTIIVKVIASEPLVAPCRQAARCTVGKALNGIFPFCKGKKVAGNSQASSSHNTRSSIAMKKVEFSIGAVQFTNTVAQSN